MYRTLGPNENTILKCAVVTLIDLYSILMLHTNPLALELVLIGAFTLIGSRVCSSTPMRSAIQFKGQSACFGPVGIIKITTEYCGTYASSSLKTLRFVRAVREKVYRLSLIVRGGTKSARATCNLKTQYQRFLAPNSQEIQPLMKIKNFLKISSMKHFQLTFSDYSLLDAFTFLKDQ